MSRFCKKLTLAFLQTLLRSVVTLIRDKNNHFDIISYIHHWIIWYCTKICCCPLTASCDSSKTNFLLLGPRPAGWKKTATVWIPYAAVLRISFAVLAALPSVTFTQNGMLNTDFCLYTLACTIFFMASLHGVILVRYQDDLMLLYNRMVSLRKAFIDKYARTEHSLDVYSRLQFPLWALSWWICILFTPLLLLLLSFYSRNSPLGLSYYLVTPRTDAGNIQAALVSTFVILDWILFMGMTYAATFMIFSLAEVAIILNAAIKFISDPAFMENGRKVKRHCYNQLQLLVSHFNTSFSHFLPYPIYTGNAAAVVAATFLLRPDADIARTLPGLYPLMFEMVLANFFIIFPFIRYLETIKLESECVVQDVELVMIKRTVWVRKDGKMVPKVRLSGKRLNKLRTLQVKFGQIRYVDEGMMASIAMAFIDNVVNLVFMVEIRNSSWLLKLPR